MTEQQQQQQLQQLQQQLQQPSFRVIRELAAGGLSCMTGSACNLLFFFPFSFSFFCLETQVPGQNFN